MGKIMSTLNGYEIVDDYARTQIENIETDMSNLSEQIANQILVLTESELEVLTQEELAQKYEKGTRFIIVDDSENLVPSAINSSGTIYNGSGFMNGYRLNSSGEIVSSDGATITGYIPYEYGKTIEITGGLNVADYGGQYIATYNDNFELIGGKYLSVLISDSKGSSVCNEKNIYLHTIKTSAFATATNTNMFNSAKYIRVSLNPCDSSELFVKYVE